MLKDLHHEACLKEAMTDEQIEKDWSITKQEIENFPIHDDEEGDECQERSIT
jgi:hypothetical protein